jgi:hypothetical protein
MLTVMIWWVVNAHKWFKGPKINVEHRMLGHLSAVDDGVEAGKSTSSTSSEIRNVTTNEG